MSRRELKRVGALARVRTGEGFFTTSSTLPAPISAFMPAADVGVLVSDGQGKISGNDTISFGGQIIPRTFMGTYKVNSDCTGTRTLQFDASPTVDVTIVLDERGHEVRALQTKSEGALFTVLAREIQ